ncbi:hypothetical protein SYNPS1DRAFT_20944 [Syncephalis pseudoplumigaleata]|uniref:Uncharacterized protein n=1 Tax=Syncephalis pseudoplumigaleata TaxID=1712513 RepID=A0A4P9Z4W6_9FUNG|nr:hypothetical protein SYNPS1DRAFT_20944 [Syncephalis pseudoplumigaleata]|eukprot:RKP27556.1 hypothetical protein SYNPS1DRAFT_20944 [Syncephalis pseudoplumigaleata]
MSFPASRVISHDRIAIKHKSCPMNPLSVKAKESSNRSNDCLYNATTPPLDIQPYSKYAHADADDCPAAHRSYDMTAGRPSISHRQSKEAPGQGYSLTSSYESTSSACSTNNNKDRSTFAEHDDAASVPDNEDDAHASPIDISALSSRSSGSARLAMRHPASSIDLHDNVGQDTGAELASSSMHITDTWIEPIASPRPMPLASRINCGSPRESIATQDDDDDAHSDAESFLDSYLKPDGLPSAQSTAPSPCASGLSNDSAFNEDSAPAAKAGFKTATAAVCRKASVISLDKSESAFGAGSISTPNCRASADDQTGAKDDESDDDEEICTARAVMTPFSANGESLPPLTTTPIQRLMTPVVVAVRRNPSLVSSDSPTSREFVKLPTRPCSIASPLPLSPSELRHLALMSAASTPTTPLGGSEAEEQYQGAQASVEVEVSIPSVRTSASSANRKPSCAPDAPTDFPADAATNNAAASKLSGSRRTSAEVLRSHRPKSNSASSIAGEDALKHKGSLNCLLARSSEHPLSRRGSLPSDMDSMKLTVTTDLPPSQPESSHSSASSYLGVTPPPVKSKSPLRKSLGHPAGQEWTGDHSPASSTSRTASVDLTAKPSSVGQQEARAAPVSASDRAGGSNQLDSLEAFIRSQFGFNQTERPLVQQRSMSDVGLYAPPMPANMPAALTSKTASSKPSSSQHRVKSSTNTDAAVHQMPTSKDKSASSAAAVAAAAKSASASKQNTASYSLSQAPPPPTSMMPMRLPRDQFIVKLVIDHDHRIALCVSANAGFEAFYLLALRKAVRAGFAESDVRERLLVLSLEGRLTRITDENGFRLMEKAFRHHSAQQPTVHWV